MVAVLERKTYIYNLVTMEKFTVFDSFDNPKGVCALSTNMSNFVVAMPTHNDGKHWVSIYSYTDRVEDHTFKWSNVIRQSINAHRESVGALTLNANGTLLATGSVTGSKIKIFSTSDCALLRKLVRG